MFNFNRGEERSGEKSMDFHMKSSSSEESVRKRSHSVGANSLAPSVLAAMTTTNICDIDDVVMNAKQDVLGESSVRHISSELLTNFVFADSAKSKSTKYLYHDDPHSFETSMDFLVVASNNNSLSMSENTSDLDSSIAPPAETHESAGEHIYSNSLFKFEVLETTV